MFPSYRNQSANQLTGFYMMATLVVKTLITIDRRGGQLTPHVMRSGTSVFFKKWRLKLQFRNFQTSNFYFVLWFAAKYMICLLFTATNLKNCIYVITRENLWYRLQKKGKLRNICQYLRPIFFKLNNCHIKCHL